MIFLPLFTSISICLVPSQQLLERMNDDPMHPLTTTHEPPFGSIFQLRANELYHHCRRQGGGPRRLRHPSVTSTATCKKSSSYILLALARLHPHAWPEQRLRSRSIRGTAKRVAGDRISTKPVGSMAASNPPSAGVMAPPAPASAGPVQTQGLKRSAQAAFEGESHTPLLVVDHRM